ncbi:MAG: squalene--hopene cyclase, partial [Syntrophobacteraceae bacterium]
MGKRSVTARAVEGEEIWRSIAGKAADEFAIALSDPAYVVEVSKPAPPRPVTIHSSWIRRVKKAIDRTCGYYNNTQYPGGYWWSELESNVTITAEHAMLVHLLGMTLDDGKQKAIIRYLLKKQDENGAWGLYYGDGGELSTTIEAYFALKLLGEDPWSEPMVKARQFILDKGGIESARVFTKIWLALFGEYDWDKVPSMPVELVLLPPHFYFSIYEFSSWARGTAVPLSIVLSIRPKLDLPEHLNVTELY